MKTIILDNITPLLEYVINQKIKQVKTDIHMPDPHKQALQFYTIYNLYKMPDNDSIKDAEKMNDTAYKCIERLLFQIYGDILDYPEPLDRDEKLLVEMIKSIPEKYINQVLNYIKKY